MLELVLVELDADPTLNVAINVSGLTTSDPQWLRRLVAAARATRIDPAEAIREH
mgnify:CR=1 FL=1